MGLLDGGLAGVFAAAFSGIYLDGTLHRRPTLEADAGGSYVDVEDDVDLADPETWPSTAVKAQIDQATEAMRRAEGFTDGDVRILVLAAGIDPITTSDEIAVSGTRYTIHSVGTDPAHAYYELRGRKA